MTQLSLQDVVNQLFANAIANAFHKRDNFRADGATYEPKKDKARLSRQLDAVKAIMLDGRRHTLAELAEKCNASEASVSARIRDLRKSRNGGWDVRRARVIGGLYVYWVQK